MPDEVTEPATDGLITTTPASNTPTPARRAPVPAPVIAIPQTAPLECLQRIPVLGPGVVTPIVMLLHQIPLIAEILHPLIGYPVQVGLPAGTPIPRDVKVVSFDGTLIYVHFFPATGLQAGQTAPTILDGSGLGEPGSMAYLSEKDEVLHLDVGGIGIGALRDHGYNVVTWDPRGEWNSGGQLELDSPEFEARDVSAIISWVATQPDAQLDHGVLDPRIGMIGTSYGGGIQLVSAAVDHRIDAIVPMMAWHSLSSSLYKNDAFKSSWGTLLSALLLGTFARPTPRFYPAVIWGDLTGRLPQSGQDLFATRGPGDLVDAITAPTLLIQGTVDTLFTLQEADDNATALLANGTDTAVLWFCGGHGTCLTGANDVLIGQRTFQWLDRYVKGDLSVQTGPQFEWIDQHGQYYSSNSYPVRTGTPITASTGAGGVLTLLPFVGGSGPQAGPLGIVSASKASNALNLTTAAATTRTYVVGAPQLTFTYSGTGTSTHVYAQLVDDTTGLVLGNLVTPVSVRLDGQTHTVTVSLEEIAQTLSPGETLTLQLAASAVLYQTFNCFGVLDVSTINLSLPTARAADVSTVAV